jgi:hypothetical protein
MLHEYTPHELQQLIRLPCQQYNAEKGSCYNRHLRGKYHRDWIELAKGILIAVLNLAVTRLSTEESEISRRSTSILNITQHDITTTKDKHAEL